MIKLILFLIISIIPAYAQNSSDSFGINDVVSGTNTTETISEITITKSTNILTWNAGIFSLVGGATTLIGILLTIRFVYIDKIHEEKIRKIRDDIEKTFENQENDFNNNKFQRDNIRWLAEYMGGLYIALEKITSYRHDNNHIGIIIDIICMGALFIIGAVATTGFFENIFIILLILVGLVAFTPILHFIIQLKRISYKIQFNHS